MLQVQEVANEGLGEESPLRSSENADESSHIEMVFRKKKISEHDKTTEDHGMIEARFGVETETNDSGNKFCVVPKCMKPYCPPRDRFGFIVTGGCMCFVFWAAVWSLLGKDALPGGNIFSLLLLLVSAALAGFLVTKIPFITLPPLLGMLITGFIFRNIPGSSITKNIDKQWSMTLRNIALVIILLRSGLGLDIQALKRLKCTVLRLAFCPCLVEAVTVGIVSHFLLGIPWLWAFMLGFILGAVSPAVVVPSMLNLQLSGYGTREGIPTLVMAASSCDDVLAISLFSVFLGIAFSQGNLIFNIFRGPLELCLGIVVGLVIGGALWYIPAAGSKQLVRNRSFLLVTFGLLSLFGSNRAELSGAGALGVLSLGAVAGYGWKDEGKIPVEKILSSLWTIFQPLLFGLIGAEVSLDYLSAKLVGRGMATLAIGLVLRILVTYSVVFGNKLNVKEKVFIALSWLPKATVQAAIGSIPLDTARARGFAGKQQEEVGIQILTIAVLVILVTAPIGAIAIAVSGPKLLRKQRKSLVLPDNVDNSNDNDDNTNSFSLNCLRK